MLDGVSFSCDVIKTWRLILFAMFVMGPGVHYWNRMLEYVFFGWNPLAAVLWKVALDQTVFTFASLTATIAVVTWAEQKPMSNVPNRIRNQLWPLTIANWKVWGPTMCLVYAFVQEDLRPLVLNVVSIGWQIFYLMLLREPPKGDMPKVSEDRSVPDAEESGVRVDLESYLKERDKSQREGNPPERPNEREKDSLSKNQKDLARLMGYLPQPGSSLPEKQRSPDRSVSRGGFARPRG